MYITLTEVNFALLSVVPEAPGGHESKPADTHWYKPFRRTHKQHCGRMVHTNTTMCTYTPPQASLYSSDVFTEPKGWLLKIIQHSLSQAASGRIFVFEQEIAWSTVPKGVLVVQLKSNHKHRRRATRTKTHTKWHTGKTSLFICKTKYVQLYNWRSFLDRGGEVTWIASATVQTVFPIN